MKRTLRYRLFKSPGFPPALAEAAPGALLAEEGVSVKVSARDVRAPRLRVSSAVRLTSGSLVVRPERTMAAVGGRQLLGPDGPACATLRFAEDGMHVVVDVAGLLDGARGTVELVFRGPLEPAVLAAVGTDERAVTLSSEARLRSWLGGGAVAAA